MRTHWIKILLVLVDCSLVVNVCRQKQVNWKWHEWCPLFSLMLPAKLRLKRKRGCLSSSSSCFIPLKTHVNIHYTATQAQVSVVNVAQHKSISKNLSLSFALVYCALLAYIYKCAYLTFWIFKRLRLSYKWLNWTRHLIKRYIYH